MSTVPKPLKKVDFDGMLNWVRKTLAALSHLDTVDKKQLIKVIRSLLAGIRGGESAQRLLSFRAFHDFIKHNNLIRERYQRYKKMYGAKARSFLGWLRITEDKAVLKLLEDKFDDISLYLGKAVIRVDLKRLKDYTPTEFKAVEDLYIWLSNLHPKAGTQLTSLLLAKFNQSKKVRKPFEIGNIINLLSKSKDEVPRVTMNFIKGSLGEALTLPSRVDAAKRYLKNGVIVNGKRIRFDEILVLPQLRGNYVDIDGNLLKGKETTDGLVVGKVAGTNNYRILEIHEVKTTVDSTSDAVEQFTRRQENLGELNHNAEGLLALIADGDYYQWKPGNNKPKAVKVDKNNPLTLDLNRSGKPNTVGYHQAKMKMFVPADQMTAIDTINPRFELASIGQSWESLEKLAALMTANLMR